MPFARLCAHVFLIFAALVVSATAQAPLLRRPPLYSVILDPASFDGQRLQLNGFLTGSFELYVTSEQAAASDHSSSIEIEPPSDNVGYVYMREICSGFRVSIWGTFRSYRDSSNYLRYALQDVDQVMIKPIDPDLSGELQQTFACLPMSEHGRLRARELKQIAKKRKEAIAYLLAGSPPVIPRCLGDAPNPDHEEAKQFLEGDAVIATAAAPDALLEVMITLERRDYDDAHLPYEKKVELISAFREPTRSRLQNISAEIVREGKHTGYFQVNIPAQHVMAAYCWPDVLYVNVTTPYWTVVEPFWDAESVGSMECPVIDGTCPEHCNASSGVRYEAKRQCWSPIAELIACDWTRAMMYFPEVDCSVRLATGEIINANRFTLAEPEFKGWRRCTDDELKRVRGKPRCE